MGKNKRYFVKTISFGKEGNTSRIIAEKLINKVGPRKFSILIQDLLVSNYSRKKEFDFIKIEALITERKQLGNQIKEISKKLQENAENLEKKGVDINNL